MASYTVATGLRAAHDKTLVASTVDTVTFADDCDRIEVLSDGAAAIYFTTDGSTPTVSGANCYPVPSGSVSAITVDSPRGGGSIVKLISSGTPKYSVTRVA